MAGSSESGARHFALNLAVLRRLFCTMAALLLFASQPLRAEPALERMSNPLRVATPGGNFLTMSPMSTAPSRVTHWW